MLILAFDTATPAVTVALHDGNRPVAHESATDARHHGELLAPAIAKVLATARATMADLTSVAVGVGPGPYTGLRAGLVTARVLGSTLGIEVDGICSLDIIAVQARRAAGGRDFIVATDARRREVYWARYAGEGQRLSGPDVGWPAELPPGYPLAGAGAWLHADAIRAAAPAAEFIEPRLPDAAVLAALAAERIAGGVPPGPAEPLYLRRPDAREPGRPKRVTPAAQGAR